MSDFVCSGDPGTLRCTDGCSSTALLYVHRCFFANALMDHPTDPMRSQYAPSFLAGYRSACTLLSMLREQFELFPTQIARFWVLWTHAFSACVSTRVAVFGLGYTSFGRRLAAGG